MSCLLHSYTDTPQYNLLPSLTAQETEAQKGEIILSMPHSHVMIDWMYVTPQINFYCIRDSVV